MNQQDSQEPVSPAARIEDLTIEELVKIVIKGGSGGIQKLGSRRLILQGDSTS